MFTSSDKNSEFHKVKKNVEIFLDDKLFQVFLFH